MTLSAVSPSPSAAASPVPPLPSGPPAARPVEEVRPLTYEGFRYDCRVLWQRHAVTEPMLLLSGAAQDKYAWSRQEPGLTGVATVVTVDLPGWGASDVLPASYGVDFLADVVRHTLDELEIGRVNVVGACYGGAIATQFVQRCPDLPARLALVAAQRTLPEETRRAFREAIRRLRGDDRRAFADFVVELFAPDRAADADRRRTAVARLLHRQFLTLSPAESVRFIENTERLLLHPLHGPAPAPSLPALIVHGELDRFAPPSAGQELAGTMPGSSLAVFSDVGHLVPLERPEELTDLLLRFFTDRPLDELPYCTVEQPRTAPETV